MDGQDSTGREEGRWNAGAVRGLVEAASSDQELVDLCFDHFRPVYDQFASGQPRGQRIIMLVEYAERQRRLDELVELVRRHNPAAYREYAARLASTAESGDGTPQQAPQPPEGSAGREEMEYLDFEVRMARAEEGYTVHVLHSPAGEATTGFTIPASDLELENFVLRVGRTRRGVRRIGSSEWESARAIGGKLFDAMCTGDVRACLRSSLYRAELEGRGLRIKLRLLEAPELADWPWEYLYNRRLNRFLSLSAHTPVIRYIEMPEVMSPLTVEPPLCVLVMISSPSDYPQLDVEREKAHLQEALGGLEQQGMVQLDWLEEASLLALQRRLRRGRYHIFHFIGHGGFDESTQDGQLLMEDRQGRGQRVSGQYLGVMLHDHRTLRMAVLNACEGARSSRTDPFAGVAMTLVQQGIPAVVAMQFEITDEAAIVFASEFYTAIADGYPVDASLAEARKAIFATGNDVEWGTPVLYMRTPDGRIFGVRSLTPERRAERQLAAEAARREREEAERRALEQRQAQLARLHAQALERLVDQDWHGAHELLARIEEMEPGYLNVPELLAQAREGADRQEQISALHTSAQAHLEAGRWSEAITGFQAVMEMDPGHEEAARLLAEAQARSEEQARQAELARRYDAADEAAQAGEWAQAIEGFQAVQKLDADYRDVAARLRQAQEALAAEEAAREQEARLADLYQKATDRVRAEEWSEAEQLLREVERVDPSYRDVAALLAQVRSELDRREQLAALYEEAEACFRREEWAQAVELYGEVLALEPGYQDAEERLAEAQRQQWLADQYAQGLEHLRAERWQEAIESFQAVLEMDPSYEEAARLLARARQEKERQELPPPPVGRRRPLTQPEEIRPRRRPEGLPEELPPRRKPPERSEGTRPRRRPPGLPR